MCTPSHDTHAPCLKAILFITQVHHIGVGLENTEQKLPQHNQCSFQAEKQDSLEVPKRTLIS